MLSPEVLEAYSMAVLAGVGVVLVVLMVLGYLYIVKRMFPTTPEPDYNQNMVRDESFKIGKGSRGGRRTKRKPMKRW